MMQTLDDYIFNSSNSHINKELLNLKSFDNINENHNDSTRLNENIQKIGEEKSNIYYDSL